MGITEEQVEHYQELPDRNYLEATRFIDYRYFAIITEGHPLNDPQAVVRQWKENGAFKEEQYVIGLKWEPSDLIRQQDVQAVPIDAYAVDVFKFTQLKRSKND
ncbi:hypothetical protein [Lentzea albidocapillata]|uniref:Uncharacterized protein n=1 Tax=Lentzea albidocapillata TaxID=40571 RepID=A0A1W2CSQ2_9PSEU|nr:hypothetical protein [Lentzea albidocapillata]SMC88243.1 hypothetical protein SAMN05660733_02337 [Lentzea albidocapillata]